MRGPRAQGVVDFDIWCQEANLLSLLIVMARVEPRAPLLAPDAYKHLKAISRVCQSSVSAAVLIRLKLGKDANRMLPAAPTLEITAIFGMHGAAMPGLTAVPGSLAMPTTVAGAASGSGQILEALLEAGAPVEAKIPKTGQTALHITGILATSNPFISRTQVSDFMRSFRACK